MLRVRKELSLQLARNGEFAHKDCFAARLKIIMLVASPIRGQHVITGRAERDPESRQNPWIPTPRLRGGRLCAGMFMRLWRTLDDETFVGATRRSPLRGRLAEPPLS